MSNPASIRRQAGSAPAREMRLRDRVGGTNAGAMRFVLHAIVWIGIFGLAGLAVAKPNETDLSEFVGIYEGQSTFVYRQADFAFRGRGDGTVLFRTRQDGLGALMRWLARIDTGGATETSRLRQNYKFDKGGRVRIQPLLPLIANEGDLGSKYSAKSKLIRIERNVPALLFEIPLSLKILIRVQEFGDRKRLKLIARLTNDEFNFNMLYRFVGTTAAPSAN